MTNDRRKEGRKEGRNRETACFNDTAIAAAALVTVAAAFWISGFTMGRLVYL
jgi:hypothetical protein